jgi:hypothetical protein
MSEIEKTLKRHEENQAYSDGLIKSETAQNYNFSKEEIQYQRNIAKEYMKEHGLDKL